MPVLQLGGVSYNLCSRRHYGVLLVMNDGDDFIRIGCWSSKSTQFSVLLSLCKVFFLWRKVFPHNLGRQQSSGKKTLSVLYFYLAFWKLICVSSSLIHNICLCVIYSFVILLQWYITKNVFWLSRGLSSLHLRLASVLLPYNTQHSKPCTTWHKWIPHHQCNTPHVNQDLMCHISMFKY